MGTCTRCTLEINEDEMFTCDGGCGKMYHVSCAGPGTGVTKAFHKLFKENEYFIFMCTSCRHYSLKAANDKLNKVMSTIAINDERINRYNEDVQYLKQSFEEMNTSLAKSFKDLKTEVNKKSVEIEKVDVNNLLEEFSNMKKAINSNNRELNENIRKAVTQTKPMRRDTYAERVKMFSEENVILVKPRVAQESARTKEAVKTGINPVNIAVSGVHNVSKGGVIIKCPTKQSMNELKDAAIKNLGNDYDVTIPVPLKPKIKILGFHDNKSPNEIEAFLKNQNSFTTENVNAYVKVVRIEKNKNSRMESYNILVELDGSTYKSIMDQRTVNIHWQRCRVVDCLDLQRCFKCSGFNHKADRCNSKIACPRCSGEHSLKDCDSTVERCINCVTMNTKLSLKLDVEHTVWSKHCKNHQRMLDQRRRRIELAE